MMKYIIAPYIDLIGYDKLPFCLFDWRKLKTVFLDREQYSVVLDCDGRTELDTESFDENIKWTQFKKKPTVETDAKNMKDKNL